LRCAMTGCAHLFLCVISDAALDEISRFDART
jgi:hypothetical protein